MAWPCISRVCCLARFWNQFDKSDLSVPLTIQNYSDIADQEVRSVAKHVPTDKPPSADYAVPDGGNRRPARGRTEPSFRPREDYQPPGVPFPSVTQYKQDFKPWPIPKKDNFPWISNGAKGATPAGSPSNGNPSGTNRGSAGGTAKTSSYRQEYQPWTGVRPSKPVRKRPTCLSPTSDEPPPATSYQAAFSGGETQKQMVPPQVETTGPLQNNQPEKPDLHTGNKAEEQLVRTKLSPNPSAVFQSRSRIFNI